MNETSPTPTTPNARNDERIKPPDRQEGFIEGPRRRVTNNSTAAQELEET